MANPFKNLKRKQQLDIGDDNLKSLIVVQDNYLDIQDKLKALFSAEIPTEDPFPVNARELHEFLGVTTVYRAWIKRYIEHANLVEGQDFNLIKNDRVQQEGNRAVNRETEECLLTLDAAKEIAMLQKS